VHSPFTGVLDSTGAAPMQTYDTSHSARITPGSAPIPQASRPSQPAQPRTKPIPDSLNPFAGQKP
jgi:hypothetical protein